MRVVGTAGHVDHGKSTLVEALTGIDPDRLKEEKLREMTIDLGFAWLQLPGGGDVGIVDVPGHRDFIGNMLAGVGAINAALLVVAADEGVMPQTREHLAILDLLEIPSLVVALTKTDLVADPEWLELITADVHQLLSGTRYSQAELVEVSARTQTGLESLLGALERALAKSPEPPDLGRPRLPVDRVFSMSGFGTVVTGTLIDGQLSIGQEVELQPSGAGGRIRGLQSHKESVERALPASRVAVNLSGVAVDELERGEVLITPGSERATAVVDARIRLLADAPAGLRHGMQLKLFCGSAQRIAYVRMLQSGELRTGESGWVQLRLEEPLLVRRGDRLVVRRPSPGATLGGGQVADPHPPLRYRRDDPQRRARLNAMLDGSDRQRLLGTLSGGSAGSLGVAAGAAGLDLETATSIAEQAHAAGELALLNPGAPPRDWQLMTSGDLRQATARAAELVDEYHQRFPARSGMPREELRSRLGGPTKGTVDAMIGAGELAERGDRVALPEFEPRLSEAEHERLNGLLQLFVANPEQPPSVKECVEAVGSELFNYLLGTKKLVRISEAVVLEAEQYHRWVDQIEQQLADDGSLTVAEVRNRFNTTRKYALALMEHLDLIGVTYREGDERRLVRPAKPKP